MQQFITMAIEEMRLRNLSRRTIECYTRCLREFFTFINEPYDINQDSVRRHLLHKIERGCGPQTARLHLNAIHFFCSRVIREPLDLKIKFPKIRQRLPVVLSKNEILVLIDSIKNSKHRIMIALAYGAGLRVSEIVSLRVGDVNFEEATLHIKRAKGNKDRITVFPRKLEAQGKTVSQGHAGGFSRRLAIVQHCKAGVIPFTAPQLCNASP